MKLFSILNFIFITNVKTSNYNFSYCSYYQQFDVKNEELLNKVKVTFIQLLKDAYEHNNKQSYENELANVNLKLVITYCEIAKICEFYLDELYFHTHAKLKKNIIDDFIELIKDFLENKDLEKTLVSIEEEFNKFAKFINKKGDSLKDKCEVLIFIQFLYKFKGIIIYQDYSFGNIEQLTEMLSWFKFVGDENELILFTQLIERFKYERNNIEGLLIKNIKFYLNKLK